MAGTTLGQNNRDGHQQRRLQRRPSSIRTERRPYDGLVSGKQHSTSAHYLEVHRERRVRECNLYLKRCCILFLLSMTAVGTAPHYSHRYYMSWAVSYGAFFLMLPSVLPCDNSRIFVMLIASLWNCVLMISICAIMVRRKYRVLKSVDCECLAFCQWNVGFWSFHLLNCIVVFALIAHAATRLKMADALNRYWRLAGYFFGAIASVSLVDDIVASIAGAPQPALVLRWKVALSFELYLIGSLCLSHRFKIWMWGFAASYGNVTFHISNSRPASLISIHNDRNVIFNHMCVTS